MARRHWLAGMGALVVVIVASPCALAAVWRARHPAPLGRSARDVDSDGLFVTRSVRARLDFDSAGRLLARRTEDLFTGP